MLNVAEVSKSFGAVHAVRGVSFALGEGEVVGLLGPNGAGKSTTIRMIVGLLAPDAGAISVAGHDTIAAGCAARARIGYLPESAPCYPEMTVRGYLMHRARLCGVARRGRGSAVDRALGRCLLNDVAHRRIGALSKGYRQRTGLAAAIVHDPPVLILDEPTTGLDPSQVLAARRLIAELAGRRTMLLSSHVLTEVERTCGRVIVLAGGRVLADGTPRELAARFAGGEEYVVEVKDATEAGRWRGVEGVISAESSAMADGWVRWRIRGRPGTDLRELLARAAMTDRVGVREVSRREATLEQAFVALLEREGQRRENGP